MKEKKYPCWSCGHEQTVYRASCNDGCCVKCNAELMDGSDDPLWPPAPKESK